MLVNFRQRVLDRELISELEKATFGEKPPTLSDLTALYDEVGVVFNDHLKRVWGEAKDFHESVIQNRKSYLQEELEAAHRRLEESEPIRQTLDQRRSVVMGILKSGGALEHFTLLQAEYGRLEADAQTLRLQFERADQLEQLATEQEIERKQLLQRLQRDFSEQAEVLQRAIIVFEEIRTSLYEQPGNFIVRASENGPEFIIKLPSDRSSGIGNMKVFCFDMMLMRLLSERGIGPGFLVHDSHIFDGVDERQTASALRVGARYASEFGFQYIVTLNSDGIPKEFNDDEYLISTRLTDVQETGGLFGIRFG